MQIFYTISKIKKYISEHKNKKISIGFVPTMGALHKGHISLIDRAKAENDICICSIFVNPIQFNNKEDLLNYPRHLENDITQLIAVNCDILFAPSEKEMYPVPDNTIYNLGGLDKFMEGKFRLNHFNGVAVIVKKLFEIVEPNRAYFGAKDFQQLVVIKYLVKKYSIPVEIISCNIVREDDGLALSSRNARLTKEERAIAPFIHQILLKAKEKSRTNSVNEIKNMVSEEINAKPLIKLEYFEIVNKSTLENIEKIDDFSDCIACIAVFVGNIRLIDNINFL
ncbi:MAG: pantoate--beta-alanine ligase [Bacteroidetes bacterium]|nr:pantoate--beta-alanine ligase [Bacteroidota bacterium]